ncbi:MAG: cupin domain-containing protein [Rhodospirillaceae bacterium]|jgi:quercetin dioxygenase-like cupin family protein|nr:cupin domain-containing protein [Rhodospirillaceae bacterium]MBT5944376.1 cupin domain-containing protein [Rhodospirillaceae bacterium]MBT6404735.1 cupin domain-containing protein [Rhodospirillaceae bacterium]MBT6536336.1 cupin domain-containing protein [Rhodospirillaceae bacterium]MBT7360658.1 cupin domain-containing protein [Rhodospirillaceae bacterium]
MHKVATFDSATLAPHPKYGAHAHGLNWSPFVEHADDTVHISYGIIEVTPGGETELTIQAHETGLYLIEGAVDVIRDGRAYRLVAGDFMLIPTGIAHAYRNAGSVAARWIEMCAPQPKAPDAWQDTWFDGAAEWPDTPALINLADRRDQMVGHYDIAQHTPPLTITPDLDGFSQRMMIDDVFGAVHFNMFVINFANGGICNHHDHAFEEAYYVLGGEVDIVFDGQEYLLKKGDFAWTGVGAQHAFFPREGTPVHWLEIQAPQPPLREGVRFYSPWDNFTNVIKF